MPGQSPAIFKPQLNADKFDIYHRSRAGKLDRQFGSKEAVTTCVVECINISRHMMTQEKVRKAYAKVVRDFCKEYTDAWVLKGRQNNAETWEQIVFEFAGIFLHGFPMMLVDDSLENPELHAVNVRLSWTGIFNASDQMLNQPKTLPVTSILGDVVGFSRHGRVHCPRLAA